MDGLAAVKKIFGPTYHSASARAVLAADYEVEFKKGHGRLHQMTQAGWER